MATLAIYGGHHPGFVDNSTAAVTSQAVMQQQVLPSDDQYITTFFCRARYDYKTNDPSSLPFQKGDIIEVLTQLESGWWDGLLGEERGWFPSNYVTVITDEEAEAALAASEASIQQYPDTGDSIAVAGTASDQEGQWLDVHLEQNGAQNGVADPARAPVGGPTQSSDFWMPQVTPDGQIYYVNTKTGQSARDLPQEADDEISDSDLAGLASQSSSRSGTSAGLGFSASGSNNDLTDSAGFGLLKRTGTPEPWVKKLADDGMSYYYFNKYTGQIEWTRPAPVESSHSRDSASATLQGILGQEPPAPNHRGGHRRSGPIDTSDPQYRNLGLSNRSPPANGDTDFDATRSQGRIASADRFAVDLTSAERLAQSLQHALTPNSPELVTDMSEAVRREISAILEFLQSPTYTRYPDDDSLDRLVDAVVVSVRNLLYISAPPSQIPANVLAQESRDMKDHSAFQSLLKPAQRKVTTSLSKLVISARAMQYEPGSPTSNPPNRIEGDAEDLERAIAAYVLAVERYRNQELTEHEQMGPKRLRGIFGTANVGLGLVGAGAAASWKGFGWVALDDYEQSPRKMLCAEVLGELASLLAHAEDQLAILVQTSLNPASTTLYGGVAAEGQLAITQVSSFLTFLSNIHIARHVDIDGISQESGQSLETDPYTQTVSKARQLVRTLEVAAQSLYDDSAIMLIAFQSIRRDESGSVRSSRSPVHDQIEGLAGAMQINMQLVHQTLEALLTVGQDQAELSQGDYNGSIEWRLSRLSMIHTQFGGTFRPVSQYQERPYEEESEDVVDLSHAFQLGTKPQEGGETLKNITTGHQSSSQLSESSIDASLSTTVDGSAWTTSESSRSTAIESTESSPSEEFLAESDPTLDDDLVPGQVRPGNRRGNKPWLILGEEAPQHYQETVNADLKPWYLRPNYSPTDILIDYPEGVVRGGTVPALVERLTAHEHGDPAFIKTFLMTYKSFTTLDELFELLVQRFWIQPPPNLTPSELAEWKKLKQHIIQMRVLNTFKSMVVDDDVLEKEDLYILDRMKEFSSNEEVIKLAAAKQLMIHIERAQRGGDAIKMMTTAQQTPPPPIMPKTSKKLKLLDIDPLELARQLTIMESQLYQKIRPIECLQRAREQKADHNDNIAAVIQTSNRIADWVADSILNKEDSRRRAACIKQFINIADRCRSLHNYSTMVAITSGLNTPPIRRLKRTWELVNARFMSQLGACEMTIDSNKNFNNYRNTLASVTPPCVPFIGVFLTTLQFIQDGSKDNLSPGIVNFRKRQKASEVIQDIKRWQSQQFAFHPIPSVLAFIDESLNQFNDTTDIRDRFWNLSLDREPREREDEKMARLLQESGFL